MLKVHHLNNSRSQRILWLLEELGTPYEIVHYQRLAPLPIAPPELKQIHPLGKSPVITDGNTVVAESGAIVEYLLEKCGNGRMRPAAGTPDHVAYLQWMHYAEGSAMLPVMLKLYASRLGEAAKPLEPRIQDEIERHFAYLDAELGGRDHFVGDSLSAADVQLCFVIQAAKLLHGLAKFPNLARFVERMQERPAYRRALERGGPSIFG